MPILHTDAIILQAFAYSETSKILRLSTPAHGLISVIAKGALRPRSPYGGVLEPFTRGHATIYVKEGRELQTLSAFELTRSGQPLGHDLVRFACASVLGELVLRCTTEAADAGLFERLDRALAELAAAEGGAVESVALAHGWAIVSHLGFAPVLDTCVGCGRPLALAEDAHFDYAGGGVRCLECGPSPHARPLPAAARADLARLRTGEAVPLRRTRAHWDLFATFLGRHVLDRAPLRSFAVLAGLVERDR